MSDTNVTMHFLCTTIWAILLTNSTRSVTYGHVWLVQSRMLLSDRRPDQKPEIRSFHKIHAFKSVVSVVMLIFNSVPHMISVQEQHLKGQQCAFGGIPDGRGCGAEFRGGSRGRQEVETPCSQGLSPPPPAMGYRCVCTTGTVRHKAEVQSKSQRGKLFSDMS